MRIFTLLFITIVAVAFAKEKVFGNGSLPAFLKHFDTNSDDLIDEEERQAIRDLRAKLREKKRTSIDLNQDGKISENEVSMARAALREQMEQRRLQKILIHRRRGRFNITRGIPNNSRSKESSRFYF